MTGARGGPDEGGSKKRLREVVDLAKAVCPLVEILCARAIQPWGTCAVYPKLKVALVEEDVLQAAARLNVRRDPHDCAPSDDNVGV
jgi:hypothetical protein